MSPAALPAGLSRMPMRGWLLLTPQSSPELTGRQRLAVRAFRLALALVAFASVALALLPFVTPSSVRNTTGDIGVWGLIGIILLAPAYFGPYALYPSATLSVEDDRITAYTLWHRRQVELSHVRRVSAHRIDGRGSSSTVASLSGPDIPSLWISWSTFGQGPGARLLALVREVAQRPEVTTTVTARGLLGLPGGPSFQARLGFSLRNTALFLAYVALGTFAIIEYVSWCVATAPL